MLIQACSGSPIVCQLTACVLSKGVVTRDFTTVWASVSHEVTQNVWHCLIDIKSIVAL